MWTHGDGQWPGSTRPTSSPRCTTAPGARSEATGSKLDISPSACRIDSTGRSTTTPAKYTTPSSGAYTASAEAARSTPRWPGRYKVAGARNGLRTARGGTTGQDHTAVSVGSSGASPLETVGSDQVT